MKKRTLTLVIALVLVAVCAVGGTLAWLTDKTEAVTNTFTVGNINIELYEHVLKADGTLHTHDTTDTGNNNYKMVPGNTLPKDPTVTVKARSEDCYLFIKVEESSNFSRFMTYAIADGWKRLEGLEGFNGVYYRNVETSEYDQPFHVLKDDIVTVRNTVTKEMMDGLDADENNKPTLEFIAYAIQSAGLTDQNGDNTVDAKDAWSLVNPAE